MLRLRLLQCSHLIAGRSGGIALRCRSCERGDCERARQNRDRESIPVSHCRPSFHGLDARDPLATCLPSARRTPPVQPRYTAFARNWSAELAGGSRTRPPGSRVAGRSLRSGRRSGARFDTTPPSSATTASAKAAEREEPCDVERRPVSERELETHQERRGEGGELELRRLPAWDERERKRSCNEAACKSRWSQRRSGRPCAWYWPQSQSENGDRRSNWI